MDRDESDLSKLGLIMETEEKVENLAFQNSDLNAYESLIQSDDNPKIITAKKIDCLLKEQVRRHGLKVLDQLLKDETLIGYSFNSLWRLIQRNSTRKEISMLL